MDKNIHITGFMGVGKSSVARDLAKYLVWDFVDLDHEVEALSRRPLNNVTELDGLQAVRKWEARALDKIAEGKNQVIALGAGTLLYPSAEISTLIQRLSEDKSKVRPLFGEYVSAFQAGIPGAEKTLDRKIAALLHERLPTYVKSDMKIDTDGKSIRAITMEIEKRLRSRERQAESYEAPKKPR
jgi:shikimate kinase